MEYIQLPNTDLKVSRLALGCMRIAGKTVDETEALVRAALEQGVNFFDHADIYGGGECERLFGEMLGRNPGLRGQMVIQTKCGIVTQQAGGPRYDMSKEHILGSVKRSLERLQCGYIDILLLHRPDALCDPAEVAEAFDELHREGLVRYFGVSNHSVSRMNLLRKYLKQPLVANQLQLSIVHSCMLDADMWVNMKEDEAVDRDNGLIDYCRLNDITIQTWCSLQASWADGTFINNPKYQKLNDALERLAQEYHVTKSAVALAWLLRHPANMQAVIGTTSAEHLREACDAVSVKLTRQQWYDLYMAEGKRIP